MNKCERSIIKKERLESLTTQMKDFIIDNGKCYNG